jgi:hypothetical protein
MAGRRMPRLRELMVDPRLLHDATRDVTCLDGVWHWEIRVAFGAVSNDVLSAGADDAASVLRQQIRDIAPVG